MAVSLFNRQSDIGMAKNNDLTRVFLGDFKIFCRCFIIWDFLSFIDIKWYTLVLNNYYYNNFKKSTRVLGWWVVMPFLLSFMFLRVHFIFQNNKTRIISQWPWSERILKTIMMLGFSQKWQILIAWSLSGGLLIFTGTFFLLRIKLFYKQNIFSFYIFN